MVEKEKNVEIPAALLTSMQEQMAEMERKLVDNDAKMAGLEEIALKSASANGEPKLREKKTFEPKFRTVRLKKYPIAGDDTNLGYVIGWTNKGAFQEVDRTGPVPQVVDMIEIIFLGHERTTDGKLRAEKIKLLDLLNKGLPVHCKILSEKKEKREVPTGEEIHCTTFDPQHGLIDSGDVIDGYVAYTDITLTLQIPGVEKPLEIDSLYVN